MITPRIWQLKQFRFTIMLWDPLIEIQRPSLNCLPSPLCEYLNHSIKNELLSQIRDVSGFRIKKKLSYVTDIQL